VRLRAAGRGYPAPEQHDVQLPARSQQVAHGARREGRYLLRTNLTEHDPAKLWTYYLQLVAVAEAFKNLKGDLAIRPIFHQDQHRIEAHIYCLRVTLKRRLHALAPGLTPRINEHVPTTEGREHLFTRYTQP
jgi:transposase